MQHVATLVSNPAAPAIDGSILARAREALLRPGPATILAGGIGADIPCDEHPGATARLRAALDGLPVDAVVQEAATRRKRLFVADMDSTMIEQECIDELADLVGARAEVAAITERAMRGEIAFEPALRERVVLLAGIPVAAIDALIDSRLTLMPGAAVLIATLKANRIVTALVSGGFTAFTSRIAARLGFDSQHANDLEVWDGRLTGRVVEPVLGADAKRRQLIALRSVLRLAPVETMAVGDGANDLAMLAEAGLGCAFRAKPAVAAMAGFRIDHADLTALLYAQGLTPATP